MINGFCFQGTNTEGFKRKTKNNVFADSDITADDTTDETVPGNLCS